MYFDENNIQYVDKYYITRRTFSKFNSKQNENIRLVTYLNIFHEKKKKKKDLNDVFIKWSDIWVNSITTQLISKVNTNTIQITG